MNLEHQNINCASCLNYGNCKQLELKYFSDLTEDEGNWRNLFDNGKRVNSPIRRCATTIIKKHLNAFRNSHVLEMAVVRQVNSTSSFVPKITHPI